MKPKEVKSALNFYGSGYARASLIFGLAGALLVALVAGLMLTDPLNLRNVGVHTDTDYDHLYDCRVSWSDGQADGCIQKLVPVSTRVYGYPMVFAAIVYATIGALAIMIAGLVLTPRRAVRSLARDMATAKTLGIDDAKDD